MEPVWLLLDGGGDAVRRRVWIFLERPISVAKTQALGVGKAWIFLDSLVRILTYQWVTGDSWQKILPRAFVLSKAPWETGDPAIGHAKGIDCFMGQA
jgi:hypothetical protein